MNPTGPQQPDPEPPATVPFLNPIHDPPTLPNDSLPQAVLNSRKALDRLIGTASDLASSARRNHNRLRLIARQCAPLLAILRAAVDGHGHIVLKDARPLLVAELDELIARLEAIQ